MRSKPSVIASRKKSEKIIRQGDSAATKRSASSAYPDNQATRPSEKKSAANRSAIVEENSAPSDSEVESESSEASQEDSELSTSESEEEDEVTSDQLYSDRQHSSSGWESQKEKLGEQDQSKHRVIYFRTDSALSKKKAETITNLLQFDFPDAIVLLETEVRSNRGPFANRPVFCSLMRKVFEEAVGEIRLEDSTHVCSTKDAFQLFSWICSQFGSQVSIVPSLRMQ